MQPPPMITTSAVRFILVLLPRRRGRFRRFRVPGSGFVRVQGSGFRVRGSFGVLGSGFRVRRASCERLAHDRTTLPGSRLLAAVERLEAARVRIHCHAAGIERLRILRSDPAVSAWRAANDRRGVRPIPAQGFRPISGVCARIADGNPEPSRRRARLEVHHDRGARELSSSWPTEPSVRARGCISISGRARRWPGTKNPRTQNREPRTREPRTREPRTPNQEPRTNPEP